MKNKIREMLVMQNELNIITCGEDWVKGITTEGRKIEWGLCMDMEASEAIDSLNWKHWKDINMKPDYDNLKLELVDIFHFLMSDIMTESDRSNGKSYIDEGYKQIMKQILNSVYHTQANVVVDVTTLEAFKGFKRNLWGRSTLSILDSFLVLLGTVGMSIAELHKIYVGKSILNKFRQDNGYKEGTYIKTWFGKEDNIFMLNVLKVLNNDETIDTEALVKALEDGYSIVTR